MKSSSVNNNTTTAAAGRPSRQRAALCCLAAAFMLLAAMLLSGCSSLNQGIGSLFGNQRKEFYQKGVDAYNNNDFYAARDYFRTAEGYANSKSYLEAIDEYERLYLEAVELLEAKDYEAAKRTFEAVEAFGNSKDYLAYIADLKAFYTEAMQLYAGQDFVAARERFVQSSDYGNAADYIKSIDDMEERYQSAMALYNEHKYRAAISVFEAIGANYKDTYDMISACYGKLEHGSVNITNYLGAYLKSHEQEGDPVTYTLTDINETGFMVSDSYGVLFTGNTDEYGQITSVSFWLDESITDQLGKEKANGLLAHCIRALDIEMMSYSDVLANMDSYTGGLATYGNFTFSLKFESSGHAVLTATSIDG